MLVGTYYLINEAIYIMCEKEPKENSILIKTG